MVDYIVYEDCGRCSYGSGELFTGPHASHYATRCELCLFRRVKEVEAILANIAHYASILSSQCSGSEHDDYKEAMLTCSEDIRTLLTGSIPHEL